MSIINLNNNKKIRQSMLVALILLLFVFTAFFSYPFNFAYSFALTVSAEGAQESEREALLSERNISNTSGIEKNNSDNLTCLEQGKELFFKSEYSEAIKQFEKCQLLDPENPEIYYYIGQSYFQQGQLYAQKMNIFSATKNFRQAYEVSDIAIEKYLKVINENPEKDHTNHYMRLAYIYQIRSLIPGVNEFQEAIDIYQKLLEEQPFLTSVYYNIGWIYFQQKEYQNAINSFLAYLESGVKSDFVYYHLGLSYDKIGERQNAEYYYHLILEEYPDSEIAELAKKELRQIQNKDSTVKGD